MTKVSTRACSWALGLLVLLGAGCRGQACDDFVAEACGDGQTCAEYRAVLAEAKVSDEACKSMHQEMNVALAAMPEQMRGIAKTATMTMLLEQSLPPEQAAQLREKVQKAKREALGFDPAAPDASERQLEELRALETPDAPAGHDEADQQPGQVLRIEAEPVDAPQ